MLGVRCWVFDVGCSMFFNPSSGGFPRQTTLAIHFLTFLRAFSNYFAVLRRGGRIRNFAALSFMKIRAKILSALGVMLLLVAVATSSAQAPGPIVRDIE